MNVFIVTAEEVMDYERTFDILGVFTTKEEADKCYSSHHKYFKESSVDREWEVEETEGHFTSYEDGYYACNHLELHIKEEEVKDKFVADEEGGVK